MFNFIRDLLLTSNQTISSYTTYFVANSFHSIRSNRRKKITNTKTHVIKHLVHHLFSSTLPRSDFSSKCIQTSMVNSKNASMHQSNATSTQHRPTRAYTIEPSRRLLSFGHVRHSGSLKIPPQTSRFELSYNNKLADVLGRANWPITKRRSVAKKRNVGKKPAKNSLSYKSTWFSPLNDDRRTEHPFSFPTCPSVLAIGFQPDDQK